MTEESARLVQEASAGDPVALDTLLERQLPRLRAFVRLRLGRKLRAKESCSDIVQSACRQVLENLSRFEYRDEASFRQWLYLNALRKIQDRHKYYTRQKRDMEKEQELGDSGALGRVYMTLSTPSALLIRREQQELFEEVFESLPADYREVVTLSKIVGMSHRDIAREMGRSEGAVRMLLSRALARLGVELQEREDHG